MSVRLSTECDDIGKDTILTRVERSQLSDLGGLSHTIIESEPQTSKARHTKRKKADHEKRYQFLRASFIERLRLEREIWEGSLRFANLLLIFILLVVSLSLSDNTRAQNATRTRLDRTFDFQDIESVQRNPELWGMLKHVSSASKELFPRSANVYSSSYTTVSILKDFVYFNAPVRYQDQGLVIYAAQNYTFSVWVKGASSVSTRTIIYKQLQSEDGLACWRWSLTNNQVQFHYGAHDFFATTTGQSVSDYEHRLVIDFPTPLDPSEFTLLTLSVTRTDVILHQNQELVGVVPLERPVTDCANFFGVMVGDQGLTLGSFYFFPFSITTTLVQELYKNGDLLGHFAMGSEPYSVVLTEVQHLQSFLLVSNERLNNRLEKDGFESDVGIVLQAADMHFLTAAEAKVSKQQVRLPEGQLPDINLTVAVDDNIDREFFTLVNTSEYIYSTNDSATRFWRRDGFPSFEGTGVTWTVWMKAGAHGPAILASFLDEDQSQISWEFWVESRGVGFRAANLDENYTSFEIVKLQQIPEANALETNDWRHHSFQLDASSNVFRWFLDGRLALEHSVPFPVTEIDNSHSNGVVTLARIHGGHGFHAINLADFRMFVGDPLSADQIHSLAFADTVVNRSCMLPNQIVDHAEWTDIYGHTCLWYSLRVEDHPSLCRYPEAKSQCPRTCPSVACYLDSTPDTTEQQPEVFYIWKSIQHIKPKSSNGTVCLSNRLTKSEAVLQCRASTGSSLSANSASTRTQEGKSVNLTDCEQLEEAIDETCTFDSAPIAEFTEMMMNSGGDFSMYFWVRPIGDEALDENGDFLPRLRLFSSVAPASAVLDISGSGQSDGESHVRATVYSACDAGRSEQSVQFNSVGSFARDQWTLVLVSFTNSSETSQMRGGVNQVSETEPGVVDQGWHQCLADDSLPFVSALETNYEMLISPIGFLPHTVGLKNQQYFHSTQSTAMSKRIGPRLSAQELSEKTFSVTKANFPFATAAVSPPVIFQRRTSSSSSSSPSGVCRGGFSDHWIQTEHRRAVSTWCQFPRECSAAVVADPSTLISCETGLQTEGKFFGNNVTTFQGRAGFSEFLYSLTDHSLIARDGALVSLENFIDTHTRNLLVLFVFFTPEMQLSTVLSIKGKMSPASGMKVAVKVDHFAYLMGTELIEYTIVQVLMVVFLVIFTVHTIVRASNHPKITRKKLSKDLLMVCWDVISSVVHTLVAVIRIIDLWRSEAETENTLGALSSIPWEDYNISPDQKTDQFLQHSEDLLHTITLASYRDRVLLVIMLILVVRILMATNFHPRLAILTGTIKRAIDDLWHALVLVLLILMCFASLATWRFGKYRSDFSTLKTTLKTQLWMMFGEFQDDWSESIEMIAFTVEEQERCEVKVSRWFV